MTVVYTAAANQVGFVILAVVQPGFIKRSVRDQLYEELHYFINIVEPLQHTAGEAREKKVFMEGNRGLSKAFFCRYVPQLEA